MKTLHCKYQWVKQKADKCKSSKWFWNGLLCKKQLSDLEIMQKPVKWCYTCAHPCLSEERVYWKHFVVTDFLSTIEGNCFTDALSEKKWTKDETCVTSGVLQIHPLKWNTFLCVFLASVNL